MKAGTHRPRISWHFDVKTNRWNVSVTRETTFTLEFQGENKAPTPKQVKENESLLRRIDRAIDREITKILKAVAAELENQSGGSK